MERLVIVIGIAFFAAACSAAGWFLKGRRGIVGGE